MPEKLNSYSSYGQKIVSLFARLLFSGEEQSLTALARHLNCSKQTVLRLVGDIRKSYGVTVDEYLKGRCKYYRIRRISGAPPLVGLTESEIAALMMCKTFAEHLMGPDLFREATCGVEKTMAQLQGQTRPSANHFATYSPGAIDYMPHQQTIRTLIEAMTANRVCQITYRAIMARRAKSFFIKPLKLFSHKDTLYLHARKAKTPGKVFKPPAYDPLLAVHRICQVQMTERSFEFPSDYDFEKVFNRNFGVIKEEAFRVEVEFSGFAAAYVSERIWSPDQKILRKGGDKIRLLFTASSVPELVAWVLSFGEEAIVLEPAWLVEIITENLAKMRHSYGME